ncbi:hypothetical protein [Streptomyces sp. H51]|uniref:hypothetical protein n=1 Tax=Streptomyces sp. H51 TaxID=3111770 RepID=UPI002D796220|nr:hypothetical protein [Streptomyces sp. H51]
MTGRARAAGAAGAVVLALTPRTHGLSDEGNPPSSGTSPRPEEAGTRGRPTLIAPAERARPRHHLERKIE